MGRNEIKPMTYIDIYSQKQKLLFEQLRTPDEAHYEYPYDVEKPVPHRSSNLRSSILIPDELLGKNRTRIVYAQEGETMYVPSLANRGSVEFVKMYDSISEDERAPKRKSRSRTRPEAATQQDGAPSVTGPAEVKEVMLIDESS